MPFFGGPFAQLHRRREVAVAPGRGLGHVAHLLVGAREQFLCALVLGGAEDRMVQQLGCPAVVALVVSRLCGGDGLVRTADQIEPALGRFLRRQRVEVGGVAVVGAEIELVDRLDVVPQVAVVATRAEEGRQRRRQLDQLGDLARRVAGVDQAHGLVVHVLVHVAVLGDEVDDARVAPHRPVVLAEIDLGVAQVVDGLLQVGRPLQRVAHLGTAHREQVVHGLRQVLGATVGLLVRDRERELGRRLGAGDVVEHEAHAVDHQFLLGLW